MKGKNVGDKFREKIEKKLFSILKSRGKQFEFYFERDEKSQDFEQ